jgi:hypothetical protein
VWAREDLTPAEQQMATIRHNRARGEHNVLRMSAIVCDLIDVQRMSVEDVAEKLSMETEEVDRLYDRRGMTVRGTDGDSFNAAWEPS